MAGVLTVRRVRRLYSGRGYELATEDGHPVYTADGILADSREDVRRRKIGVSLCSGCRVGCVYCFTNRLDRFRRLKPEEIVAQVELALADSAWLPGSYDELKVSFKQMGDPLVNPLNTLEAIRRLAKAYPDATFVVSTSGPWCEESFFPELSGIAAAGARIRLQFSCHTTLDEERRLLSPRLPMMNFDTLGTLSRIWRHGRVTLNFIVLEGYVYDAASIRRHFRPEDVFVKVGRIDPNACTRSAGLVTASDDAVSGFETALEREGFAFARRFRPEDYVNT